MLPCEAAKPGFHRIRHSKLQFNYAGGNSDTQTLMNKIKMQWKSVVDRLERYWTDSNMDRCRAMPCSAYAVNLRLHIETCRSPGTISCLCPSSSSLYWRNCL
jgi:hypothetical protein